MTALSLTLTFDGRKVRMAGTPDRPEWVAKDVCRVLHVHNSSMALWNAGVTPAEKGVISIDTPGGPQEATTILESAVWKLVLKSRKPEAIRFKEWLTSDVLPSIRKHGCYPPPEPALMYEVVGLDLDNPAQLRSLVEAFAQRRLIDHQTINEQREEIAELTPKAEGFDRLSSAEGLVNLQEAGKATGLGPNRFQWRLVDDGILFRGRRHAIEPKQEHVDAGRFVLRVREVDGKVRPQTLVTPKGLTWLIGLYGQAQSALAVH